MKKVYSFILMTLLFVSFLSFNSNYVKAETYTWGKVTINDQTMIGKIQIKKKTKTYTEIRGKYLEFDTVKKGKEYGVYSYDDKNKMLKISNNLYVKKNSNVKYMSIDSLVGKGTVQGVVSYYYNNFIGYRPDVNARVSLISYDLNKANYTPYQLQMFGMYGQVPSGDKSLYFANVDGNGNYSIENVKPGKYIFVIRSNGRVEIRIDESASGIYADEIKRIIGEPIADYFIANNLKHYKYYVNEVTVSKDRVVTISKNFGLY
ncbi:hypothetical protein ACQKM9_19955 [Viridibacillus sp. NPDC093762]|uniref:hypothetical protein n=1 Tax=Viridibacillus sp. NPDC093762 TaxID=3390720 RepID=UPI003CFDBBD1